MMMIRLGSEFGGTHLMGKANVEDAKKKAKTILKSIRKHDIRHQYRVKELHLDIKKVGTAEWW